MVKIYQVGLERQRWNAVVKQVKKGCENKSDPGSELCISLLPAQHLLILMIEPSSKD